ncbi:MAG: hypothetical protein QXV01_09615 [Candidatus Bathyarchaeia archaeon]
MFWVPPKGVKGGAIVNPSILLPEMLPLEIKGKSIKGDMYKLGINIPPYLFWNAVLSGKPYPIKALFIMGSNPLITQSNPEKIMHALKMLSFQLSLTYL